MKRLSVFFVLLATGLVASSAAAQEAPKVYLTIKVSSKVASFNNQRLVVMLYHNHPNQDDRGLTAVDRYIDQSFSHQKGRESVVKVLLGDRAKLRTDVQYSVNVTVFQGLGTITHLGEFDGVPGPISVITNGHPSKLTFDLRPGAP